MPPTKQPLPQQKEAHGPSVSGLNRSRLCPIRVLDISLVFDRALFVTKNPPLTPHPVNSIPASDVCFDVVWRYDIRLSY
jgi:hypothetical protein